MRIWVHAKKEKVGKRIPSKSARLAVRVAASRLPVSQRTDHVGVAMSTLKARVTEGPSNHFSRAQEQPNILNPYNLQPFGPVPYCVRPPWHCITKQIQNCQPLTRKSELYDDVAR